MPRLDDIDIKFDAQEDATWFNKSLLGLLNRDRLTEGELMAAMNSTIV